MIGSLEDWQKLRNKFQNLSDLLQPIKADIGLNGTWWQSVDTVFAKLLDTYQGNPDKEWWKKIILILPLLTLIVLGGGRSHHAT